jgi:glycosyltransferase involved in cell wall biosynthesis
MDRPELSAAIASLAQQTCPRLEILVIDATGGRHSPLPELPLRNGHSMRIVQAGGPLSRPQAANAGIEAVTGEFFSFLDDDDTCEPDHIAALLVAADAHPDKLVVYGSAKIVTPDGRVRRVFGARFNRALLHFGPLFYWQAALFRTSVRDLGCRVDESLEICEDRDFVAQVAEHSDFAFVPTTTLRYRADLGSSGTGTGQNRDDARRLQFDALLRARWAGQCAYHGERVTRWCRRAVEAYTRGDRVAAKEWFSNALAHYPEDPNALHGLGRLQFEEGDLESAAASVRRATEINDAVAEYQWTMALILEAQGDMDGAAAAASIAMSDPRFAPQAAQLHARIAGTYSPRVLSTVRGRLGPCPCGSGRKYKECCGRLRAWSAGETLNPRIAVALADFDRGEAIAALQYLDAIAADAAHDATSAARIAALYARLNVPLRAVEFQRRAVALGENVESGRLLTQYCDALYRPAMMASARKTAVTLLSRPTRPPPARRADRIHIISALGTLGGTENRAVGLHALLAPHADVTLWSVTRPHVAYSARAVIREIRAERDEVPEGGTLVFVGTFFDYGDWIYRVDADRVVIAHNIDLPVELVHRLTQIAENPRDLPIELTFPSERFRRHADLPGAVELPVVDLARCVPRSRTPRHDSTLVIGRHSRDDPTKHHPNDPSLYRRLVALGHRVRILGGTVLDRAFAGDAAASAIERMPAGIEEAPQFLASLDCFLYRKSPDWYETGGTVVLEAMVMKVPVVVFDDCGATDWIESGRTGFVVRSEEEALAAIARLAGDLSLRERIGEAAHAHALALVGLQHKLALAFYLDKDPCRATLQTRGADLTGFRPIRLPDGISWTRIG